MSVWDSELVQTAAAEKRAKWETKTRNTQEKRKQFKMYYVTFRFEKSASLYARRPRLAI